MKKQNSDKLSKQVNKYKIKWSDTYQKWQVKKAGKIYEEFTLKSKAVTWAKGN